MAGAGKSIGLYDEREGRRYADGTGNIEARALRRDVANHAVDAAALAKCERAVLENSLSGRGPFFDHRRDPNTGCSPQKLAKQDYR